MLLHNSVHASLVSVYSNTTQGLQPRNGVPEARPYCANSPHPTPPHSLNMRQTVIQANTAGRYMLPCVWIRFATKLLSVHETLPSYVRRRHNGAFTNPSCSYTYAVKSETCLTPLLITLSYLYTKQFNSENADETRTIYRFQEDWQDRYIRNFLPTQHRLPYADTFTCLSKKLVMQRTYSLPPP